MMERKAGPGDSQRDRAFHYSFAVIALVSCAMLMYEILLTRICALRLFFHFGFLVVSNCLLGIGASGSVIAVLQHRWRGRERLWIWASCLLFLVSLIAAYAFLITYPVDPGIRFRDPEGIGRFVLFNLVAAIPFFFAGGGVGLILSSQAKRINRAYFYDLAGAGLGCLLCPLFLWVAGAGGCIVAIALLALAAAVIAAPTVHRRPAAVVGATLGILGLLALPTIDERFPVPSKTSIEVTEEVSLDLDQVRPYSRWSAISRVDIHPVEESDRFIFGRGRRTEGLAVPEQKYILQDGSAGTYIINFSEHPEAFSLLERTSYAAAASVKEQPRVFVIGVGGGNDVWAAKIQEASHIRGVELNRQILDIHRQVLPRFSRGLLDDPAIELLAGEGRSALMRDPDRYDVIQMTGIDTWTALASGAYMLAENYLYTVEAMELMYDRLAPGGVIQITRFAREMEMLRLLANLHAAHERRGAEAFEDSVAVLVTGSLVTILARDGAFPTEELDRLDRFLRKSGIDVVYHPRYTAENPVAAFIRSEDKAAYIRAMPRDISPTPDDRPYFFNFTRWKDIFSSRQYIDEPTHVSQGNPLFLISQFSVSAALSLLFVLLPVALFSRRRLSRAHMIRFLVYFTGIGLGFIAIEIALMQKLVLLVGHPLYSITVTLFAMLVFTGIGALVSGRWFHSPTRHGWWVPAGLLVCLAAIVLLSPWIVELAIGLHPALRFLVAGAMVAPVSLLLGVPFAFGIRLLDRVNPSLVPWAWAVNGCATVVGSVLTVILSMRLGFNAVLLGAAALYFVVFAVLTGLRSDVEASPLWSDN